MYKFIIRIWYLGAKYGNIVNLYNFIVYEFLVL